MAEESKEKKESEIESRFKKIKNWLKNPTNAALVGIIVFAIAVRLYFLFRTAGQPLWWDEADYMANAKHWAFGIPYPPNVHRTPVFQLVAAFGFILGLGETILKFLIVLVPSVLLVYVVYLLGKEMYNEKIGLITAFLTSVSWTLLFWSVRFEPDFISLCFSLLAVFFMWKYWKTEKTKLAVLAGIFASLGFLFKISGLLIPMIFIIFIFCKDRFSALKNKDYYYFSIAFLAVQLPYFIWSYINYGTMFSFAVGYSNNANNAAMPFAWGAVISFLPTMAEGALFVLFVIGVVLALKFLLYADILVKDKKKCFDPDLFSILAIVVIAAFYIFYIKLVEDRWVFLWLPFMFMLAGRASLAIYNFGKKYSKIISIVLVSALLIWGAYAQLSHAKQIIDIKKDSYLPVKEAALWMKDNSRLGDKIITMSYTQTIYYSDMNVTPLDMQNKSAFEEFLKTNKPKYLELSVFENYPQWLFTWPNENNSRAVQAYFADAEQKQPVLIVYELNYNSNSSIS